MNKQKKDPFNSFDFSNFKKWMKSQNEPKESNDVIGLHVESKIARNKLAYKMELEYGIAEEVAKDFKNNGGIITEADGNKYLIEVESGTFIIHKMFVTKKTD
jgi:predicted transcriptional regulator